METNPDHDSGRKRLGTRSMLRWKGSIVAINYAPVANINNIDDKSFFADTQNNSVISQTRKEWSGTPNEPFNIFI